MTVNNENSGTLVGYVSKSCNKFCSGAKSQCCRSRVFDPTHHTLKGNS